MATIAEETQAKQALFSLLEELSKIKAHDLIRADLGKDLNFEPGIAIFERTLNIFHDLYQSNLDNVPYTVLNQLKDQAANAFDNFKKIQTFSLSQHPQNPIGVRDSLINAISDQYDKNYFRVIYPIISYSIRKGTDFKALEDNAMSIVSTIESLKKEYEEKKSKIINNMESTLQKVRQAAAEVGVSQHATHFKDQADNHESQSKSWLKATLGIAIATVAWGIACFYINPPDGTFQIIQYTVAKLIILSALYYVLVWSAKNYHAHRHNYVVNKHRQNSLSTFETFVKAAGDDPDTKNAVLLQATQSIFSAQPSGYVHKDTESESPNKFIEIMRSVSSSAQKQR